MKFPDQIGFSIWQKKGLKIGGGEGGPTSSVFVVFPPLGYLPQRNGGYLISPLPPSLFIKMCVCVCMPHRVRPLNLERQESGTYKSQKWCNTNPFSTKNVGSPFSTGLSSTTPGKSPFLMAEMKEGTPLRWREKKVARQRAEAEGAHQPTLPSSFFPSSFSSSTFEDGKQNLKRGRTGGAPTFIGLYFEG